MIDFEYALRYEKNRQSAADSFYKRHDFSIWQRPDWNNKEGKQLQKDGVDIILSYSNDMFDISPKFITVSEKFRQPVYDDICLEIYDKLEPKHYRVCKADWIAYWKGNEKVIFLDAQKIENLITELREYIDNNVSNDIMEVLKSGQWNFHKFEYKGIPIEIRSIPSTFRKKDKWKNLVVFIKDKDLEEYILESYDISETISK